MFNTREHGRKSGGRDTIERIKVQWNVSWNVEIKFKQDTLMNGNNIRNVLGGIGVQHLFLKKSFKLRFFFLFHVLNSEIFYFLILHLEQSSQHSFLVLKNEFTFLIFDAGRVSNKNEKQQLAIK